MIIEKAIAVVKEYLRGKYTSKEFSLLICEVESIVGEIDSFSSIPSIIEYEEVQKILSNINEKEQIIEFSCCTYGNTFTYCLSE